MKKKPKKVTEKQVFETNYKALKKAARDYHKSIKKYGSLGIVFEKPINVCEDFEK